MAAQLRHSDQAPLLARELHAVPERTRATRPYYAMFQGDLLAAEREDALAITLYSRAQVLAPAPTLALEIDVRRFAALTRLGAHTQASELALRLAPRASHLSLNGLALWEYYQGIRQWRLGETSAARAHMEAVLALDGPCDRRVAFLHFSARYALGATAIDLTAIDEAKSQADALVALGLRYGFRANLLVAFVQRINAALLDQRRVPAIEELFEVPGEAFDQASLVARFDLVTSFGIRALLLGQLALAHSLFAHLASGMRGVTAHRGTIARFWLMHVQARQGDLSPARESLAMLRSQAQPKRFLANLEPTWAVLMLQIGRVPEAREALERIDEASLGAEDRLRVQLYRLAAAALAGNAEARCSLKALIEGPEGVPLKAIEARLLQRLGLSDAPPPLCLSLLGQPCLRVGEDVIAFPRRKVLSLLALLALHPAGLSSAELIERLFPASDDLEPQAALRKAVYLARQVLKAAGVPDPIHRLHGRFRLREESFALIDSRELEHLQRKALECEERGHHEAARLFHRLVAWMGANPPLDGLSESCFVAPRARLSEICEQSRAYLRANDLPPSPPPLAWSEGWALLETQRPALVERIRSLQAARASGHQERALALREELLIATALGDRLDAVARGIVLAHEAMAALAGDSPDGLACSERLANHAARHPGEVDRLVVHAIGLHARPHEEEDELSPSRLLETPAEWLAAPDPTALALYLAAFGQHFVRAGQPQLAERIFDRLRQEGPSPILAAALAMGEAARTADGRPREGRIRLRWFGAPAVQVEGEAIRFPRKKCLSLIALLALHPEGLSVDGIFSLLYPAARHANAKKTVYSLVATTRKALEARGASDLIVSLPGHYRLGTAARLNCELGAFDALVAKACELERLGLTAVAGDFYRMAADLAVDGPFCDSLDEPCFDEPRRARLAQGAKAFLRPAH